MTNKEIDRYKLNSVHPWTLRLIAERAEALAHLERLTELLEAADWCQECAAGKDPAVAAARAAIGELSK